MNAESINSVHDFLFLSFEQTDASINTKRIGTVADFITRKATQGIIWRLRD